MKRSKYQMSYFIEILFVLLILITFIPTNFLYDKSLWRNKMKQKVGI